MLHRVEGLACKQLRKGRTASRVEVTNVDILHFTSINTKAMSISYALHKAEQKAEIPESPTESVKNQKVTKSRTNTLCRFMINLLACSSG